MLGRKKKRRKTGQAAPGDGLESASSAETGGEDEARGEEGGAPPAAADAAPRIGRYTIERALGQGGMGTVYLGHDPVIGRSVAIKVITARPETEDEARQYRERFLREAQAAGALVHPNIVAVHDIGLDPSTGRPYIVMEHVAGQDLKKVIRSRAPLTPGETTKTCLQIAAALDYAHGHGIVHRDIKPANVLISETGQVKITDFGVARLPGSDLTGTDQMVGSPGFMSPEQLRGGAVDGRSDLFALGVILYQLLTGRSPFEGESVSEVLYRISTQPAEPPSEIHPDVSPDFDPILERALAKDPGGRYQTGKEMMAALLALPGLDVEADGVAVGLSETPREAAGDPDRGPGRTELRRSPSAWWTLTSQWRLGTLVVALLLAFVGVNWAIHAILRGPLGKLLRAEANTSAQDAGLPRGGGPGALAMVGASLPATAAPAGRGISKAGRRLPLGAASDRPVRPGCAMTYADPSEVARVVAAYRISRPRVPALPAEAPPARLKVEFKHRIPSGRLVVLVDGKTVFSKPFDSQKEKGGGTIAHVLSIPAGKHGLEVRVLGMKGEIAAKSRIAGTMRRDRTAVLRAEERAGSRKPLRLEWDAPETGAGQAPNS